MGIAADGNGIDFYRSLLDQRRNLKVVFMTGYADHRLLQSSVFDRDHLLLEKPFTAAEMVRRVRDALTVDAPAI